METRHVLFACTGLGACPKIPLRGDLPIAGQAHRGSLRWHSYCLPVLDGARLENGHDSMMAGGQDLDPLFGVFGSFIRSIWSHERRSER
jgi:hypothetical protein